MSSEQPDGGTGEPDVLYDVRGHVATVTLNRPHRRNAITLPMLELFTEVLVRAERDRDVRVVVITGAGKGFCAGLDVKEAVAGRGLGAEGEAGGIPDLRTRDIPTVVLHEMDTPTIAAINGGAAGYGLDLALGCDMRLAAETARIVPGFAKRGVVPESGGTWYLPRLLGWAKAAEVAFLGREMTAAAARDVGLLNEVVPDDRFAAVVAEWAAEVAANAPLAVQAMKRLFRHGLSEDFQSHTNHVLLQTMLLFQTADFREGLMAFVERRPPRFEGR